MGRGDARRMLRRAAVSSVLMSADATGAKLEPEPLVLWCDGQVDLAATGKASIRWRSGVASGECAGRMTRGCGRGVRGRRGCVACDKGEWLSRDRARRRGDGVTWSMLLDSEAMVRPCGRPQTDSGTHTRTLDLAPVLNENGRTDGDVDS